MLPTGWSMPGVLVARNRNPPAAFLASALAHMSINLASITSCTSSTNTAVGRGPLTCVALPLIVLNTLPVATCSILWALSPSPRTRNLPWLSSVTPSSSPGIVDRTNAAASAIVTIAVSSFGPVTIASARRRPSPPIISNAVAAISGLLPAPLPVSSHTSSNRQRSCPSGVIRHQPNMLPIRNFIHGNSTNGSPAIGPSVIWK